MQVMACRDHHQIHLRIFQYILIVRRGVLRPRLPRQYLGGQSLGARYILDSSMGLSQARYDHGGGIITRPNNPDLAISTHKGITADRDN